MIAKIQPLISPKSSEERLYVGIDVSKGSHVCAFLSPGQRKHYSLCPTRKFNNSRLDFERLVETMQHYAPLSNCNVLMERTGHYHLALMHYLQERGIKAYEVHASKKSSKKLKSDKRDAQRLANALYNQVACGIQVAESEEEVHRIAPPTEIAATLRVLCRRRYELMQATTRTTNKLTAILDQLFPEFTEIIKNGCGETALNIRERFGTPTAIASADFSEIKACRTWRRPGDKALRRLQVLAEHTIGIKEPGRVKALVVEQRQLIAALRLLQKQTDEIEAEITAIITTSREGQILLSFGVIGANEAAAIIAVIGSISNFESAAKLKGYAGWFPTQNQTGISKNSMVLSKSGNRLFRHTMYLIGLQAVQRDGAWKDRYERLLPRMCQWDERLRDYQWKMKPLGHVIGKIVEMIYILLKKDHDLIARSAPDCALPPPILYNEAIHRRGH